MRHNLPTLSGVRYTSAGDPKLSRGYTDARDSNLSYTRGQVRFEDPREHSHPHPYRDESLGDARDRSYTLRNERLGDAQERSHTLRHKRIEDSRQRSKPLRYDQSDEDPLLALLHLNLHDRVGDARNRSDTLRREVRVQVLGDSRDRSDPHRPGPINVTLGDSRDRSDPHHRDPIQVILGDARERSDPHHRDPLHIILGDARERSDPHYREVIGDARDRSDPQYRLPGGVHNPILPGETFDEPLYENPAFLPAHPSLIRYTPLPYPPHLKRPKPPPNRRDPRYGPPPDPPRYIPTLNHHDPCREVAPIMPSPPPLSPEARGKMISRHKEWEREIERWGDEREVGRRVEQKASNRLREKGLEYLREIRRDGRRGRG